MNDLIEANFKKCRSSFEKGALECAGLPHKLRVEISNDCNLFCTFSNAYQKHGGCEQWNAKKTIQNMSFDLYRRIIDELAPYATEFWPYNYGEPFMNPQACEMLAYARSKNPTMLMEIHTNGHFFTDAEKCRKAVESGVDRLSISIDGLTQESYVQYRLNGDLNKAVKAVEGVCSQKRKLGLSKPEIIFQYIVFDHNIDEVPRVEKFARDLGVDSVNIKINIPDVEAEVARRFPEVSKTLAHDSESNYAKTNVPAGLSFCDFPWTHMTILADGRAVICCRDGLNEVPLGSVANGSVRDVWNGSAYREYRRQYLHDRIAPGVCARCPCAPQERPVRLAKSMQERPAISSKNGFRLRYLLSPEYMASRTKEIRSAKELLSRAGNVFRYLYGRFESAYYEIRGAPNYARAKSERMYYETRGLWNLARTKGEHFYYETRGLFHAAFHRSERRHDDPRRWVDYRAERTFRARNLLNPFYLAERWKDIRSSDEAVHRIKNIFLYFYYRLDAVERRLRERRGVFRPTSGALPPPHPEPTSEPASRAAVQHPRAKVIALEGNGYRPDGLLRLLRAEAFSRQRVLAKAFQSARPFKHIVLDGLFEPELCKRMIAEFPPFDTERFRNEHGHLGKAHHENVPQLGPSYRELDRLIQSPEFLGLISGITGIPDLLYDREYFGGGTHENLETMELDPHVDFTLHPNNGLYRRVNLLLYLNPEWDEAWGGALELHSDPWAPPHENRIQTIAPAFNRCVLFETSDHSWHGFEPIYLPNGKKSLSRRSFALYLYTRGEPRGIKTIPADLTVFVDRPLPPEIRVGRKLSEKDMSLLGHLIVRRDWKLKYLYDRAIQLFNELQSSRNEQNGHRDAGEDPR